MHYEHNLFAHHIERSGGKDINEKSAFLNENMSSNLLLDGGGFLLMRYLVIQKFYGTIETNSMYVTGRWYLPFQAIISLL